MENVTSTENAQKNIILNSATLTMKINLHRQCGEKKRKNKKEKRRKFMSNFQKCKELKISVC